MAMGAAFLAEGIFLALWAVVSLVISIVMIVVGFILFRDGRRERLAAGSSKGFIQDLISLVMTVRKAE